MFVDQVEHGQEISGITAKHMPGHLRKGHPLVNVKQINQETLLTVIAVPVQAPVVVMVIVILLQSGGGPQVFEQLAKLKRRQAKSKVAVGAWYI